MKTMLRASRHLLLLCAVACQPIYAQTLSPSTIAFPFNTKSAYVSGTSLSFTSQLSYSTILSAGLTLDVKAAGNLTNGPNSIPLSEFQVQTTGISGASSGTNNLITLSTTNQVLSNGISLGALSTINFSFKYTALGGTAFFVPAGTYSTTITFTLTNLLLLTNTYTGTLSVVISNTSSIILQNGGGTATLGFATAGDYQNGAQLTSTAAINAFSAQPYHISVNAQQNLMDGSNFIPISNINVKALPSTANANITSTPVPLSLSTQSLTSSSVATMSQNFDLTYYTSAGNNAFLNKPAGTYNTTLVYTITAP